MLNIFKKIIKNIISVKFIFFILIIFSFIYSQNKIPIPYIDLNVKQATTPSQVSLSLQILFLLTILSLAPAIIIMVTPFIRISIILKFMQKALALQDVPSNQIIMGLALFLSFFVMSPVIDKINNNAFKPYTQKQIKTGVFFDRSLTEIRKYLFSQTKQDNIDLFLYLAKKPRPKNEKDVPTYVLIPAYVLSELTYAFTIGVYLFIPFVVIDLIVASILMSMGMIMLPPVMISLPFKIILFILIDGWNLLTMQTVASFHMF